MCDLIAVSEQNQRRAWEIINETRVIDIWRSIGATINLVGSVRIGLLMDSRDVDFHIYTDPFVLADSFAAIARLAEDRRVERVTYANLLDAEDQCLEWHAWFRAGRDEVWKFDMIHILSESRYAGHFEQVADRIGAALTPETKAAILTVKNDAPAESKPMGIEVYQAVLRDGVRTYADFATWKAEHPTTGIIDWAP